MSDWTSHWQSWLSCWDYVSAIDRCRHRSTWLVVSAVHQHRGHNSKSHHFHQNIVVTTVEWPEANFHNHIWNVEGKELMFFPRESQWTKWKDWGSNCCLWIQYCWAAFCPKTSITAKWGSEVIFPSLVLANHYSPSKELLVSRWVGSETTWWSSYLAKESVQTLRWVSGGRSSNWDKASWCPGTYLKVKENFDWRWRAVIA